MTEQQTERTPREIYIETLKVGVRFVVEPLKIVNTVLAVILFAAIPSLIALAIVPDDLGWHAAQNWLAATIVVEAIWIIVVAAPTVNVFLERYTDQ